MNTNQSENFGPFCLKQAMAMVPRRGRWTSNMYRATYTSSAGGYDFTLDFTVGKPLLLMIDSPEGRVARFTGDQNPQLMQLFSECDPKDKARADKAYIQAFQPKKVKSPLAELIAHHPVAGRFAWVMADILYSATGGAYKHPIFHKGL